MLEIDTERTPTLKKTLSQPRRGQGSGCERQGKACQKKGLRMVNHGKLDPYSLHQPSLQWSPQLSNVFPSHSLTVAEPPLSFEQLHFLHCAFGI
jgi:hypothetical protein